MNDNLKILRDIGAQTIHSDTHIPREYIQAIIHETFDGLQSVQFMGFVSILEREYNLDLSEVRLKGKEHFSEEVDQESKVFVSAEKKGSNAKIYIFLVLVLLLSTIYITTEFEQAEPTVEKVEVVEVIEEKVAVVIDSNETNETNETSETAKKEILEEVQETNMSVEEPTPEVVVEPEVVIPRSLKILPKRKIWAGYINIETNQKYQKIFKKEFALDISKNWLLLFGSGTVRLEVNGEEVKFTSRQNMRFKYVDGVFTKITVTEFKSLNKGRKW